MTPLGGGGRRLLPGAARPVGALVWAGSLAVLAVLAWHLHRTGSGGPVEVRLDAGLRGGLNGHQQALETLRELGSPPVLAGVSLLLTALAAGLRWWRGALLALLAAPVAGAVTDLVLKPFVRAHNPAGAALAFPSGHTTSAFGLALVIALLLLPGGRSGSWPGALRLLLAAVALALAAGTAVASVALGYHRFTDVAGGAATAAVVVLTVAGLLDAPPRPNG